MAHNWIQADHDFVWHPFTQHQTSGAPLAIERAEGALLFDVDGKSYIDANSSWWVNTHGHGHPHIAEALQRQFSQLDHVVFAGVTHPRAAELAGRITGLLPDHFRKVFFSDNGSTAVEVALKMAIQYWYNRGEKRQRILALDGAYHGDTFGAMSVGQRGYFNEPFEDLFFDVDYLGFPDADKEKTILEKAEKLLSSGVHAALIVEPLVQGAAGMRMYSSAFLDQLCGLARANDVLIIFDEVMTGFGRTGRLFAMDHCSEKPDIVALSKGLTAGVLPLGLTVTGDAIFSTFLSDDTAKALLHGHSFTANALSCAVACASLDLFAKEETWENIRALGELNKAFASELSGMPAVSGVRYQGTILAIEVKDGEGSQYFSSVRQKAYAHFLEEGILLRPLGNIIFINPPYCLTRAQYDQIRTSLTTFLESL